MLTTLANAITAPVVPAASWKQTLALVMVAIGLLLLLLSGISMWRRRFRDPLARVRSHTPSDQATLSTAPQDPVPTAPASLTPQPAERPPTLGEAQQLLDLMNRAEDLASRLAADLDRRSGELRAAIAQAETTLTRLLDAETRVANSITAMRQAPTPEPTPARAPLSEPKPLPVVDEPARVRVPTPRPATEPAVMTSARPSPADQLATFAQATVHRASAPVAHAPELEPLETDPLTAEIYRLSDQGLSHIEIARRLNQHVGKVELILALRP